MPTLTGGDVGERFYVTWLSLLPLTTKIDPPRTRADRSNVTGSFTVVIRLFYVMG